jgi:hypothetical protein
MMGIILALAFHILGAVIWVGGMFAAYVCLRPAPARWKHPSVCSCGGISFRNSSFVCGHRCYCCCSLQFTCRLAEAHESGSDLTPTSGDRWSIDSRLTTTRTQATFLPGRYGLPLAALWVW